jgi:hypothetical protein
MKALVIVASGRDSPARGSAKRRARGVSACAPCSPMYRWLVMMLATSGRWLVAVVQALGNVVVLTRHPGETDRSTRAGVVDHHAVHLQVGTRRCAPGPELAAADLLLHVIGRCPLTATLQGHDVAGGDRLIDVGHGYSTGPPGLVNRIRPTLTLLSSCAEENLRVIAPDWRRAPQGRKKGYAHTPDKLCRSSSLCSSCPSAVVTAWVRIV